MPANMSLSRKTDKDYTRKKKKGMFGRENVKCHSLRYSRSSGLFCLPQESVFRKNVTGFERSRRYSCSFLLNISPMVRIEIPSFFPLEHEARAISQRSVSYVFILAKLPQSRMVLISTGPILFSLFGYIIS